MKLVNILVKSKDWKDFKEIVENLKILGYLKPNTCRSSLIRDFISTFIEQNKKKEGKSKNE